MFDQRYRLEELFRPKSAAFLLRASMGWSDGDRSEEEEGESGGQKSLSAERTFQAVSDVADLMGKLKMIVGVVWDDLEVRAASTSALPSKHSTLLF